jgi:hypothetical protein
VCNPALYTELLGNDQVLQTGSGQMRPAVQAQTHMLRMFHVPQSLDRTA